jgi:DNA-binding MarR family transcriptional regulator
LKSLPGPVKGSAGRKLRTQPPIDPGVLLDSLSFFLVRASRFSHFWWMGMRFDRRQRPAIYYALALIGANPGISPMRLARYIGLDKARGSEMLDGMEKNGVVARRTSSNDSRRHSLYLTPAGVTRLAALTEEMLRFEKQITAPFQAEELKTLISLLGRLQP